MKKQIILIILISLSQWSFAQWSKGKGNGFYKLSAWNLSADQYFSNTGEITPLNDRTFFNLNFYGEYGISNKWDLITYIPFYSRLSKDSPLRSESFSSLGDIDLGLNYNFFKRNNWSASAKLILGLPTGDTNGGSDGSFETGDGEFNQYLSGHLGYSSSFNGLPFYAKSYIGINNRTSNFSDEFRFGLESGINLFNKKAWLILRSDLVESFQNTSSNNDIITLGSIFGNNVEYISLGIEANYYLTDKLGISASYTSAISGKNIAANAAISGGIFLDIK